MQKQQSVCEHHRVLQRMRLAGRNSRVCVNNTGLCRQLDFWAEMAAKTLSY
ncbi:MAG: hypothetical protein IJU26_00340 [Synergistaceae bacterium]|nr:hypothetical protein [Synergistaceae bacterium]